MSYIFRFFLIINSLSLSFLIFTINKEMTMGWIDVYYYRGIDKLFEKVLYSNFIINNFYELLVYY